MSTPDSLKKVTIVTADGPPVKIEALFNPKEISIDKSVPWSQHSNPEGDVPMLEFSNAQNRTLSLELFFDGFEDKKDVHLLYVTRLHQMTLINPNASSKAESHPPRVIVSWGSFLKFKGVIESLGTKYTMFLENGTPVRATCSIKVKEVGDVQGKSE